MNEVERLSRDDLAKFSQWDLISFLTRCVRLAMPVFKDTSNIPKGSEELLEKALNLTESSWGFKHPAPRIEEAIAELDEYDLSTFSHSQSGSSGPSISGASDTIQCKFFLAVKAMAQAAYAIPNKEESLDLAVKSINCIYEVADEGLSSDLDERMREEFDPEPAGDVKKERIFGGLFHNGGFFSEKTSCRKPTRRNITSGFAGLFG